MKHGFTYEPEGSDQTLRVVHSFVLNDYGNACLRYFHYHGGEGKLQMARRAYEKAGIGPELR